VEQEDHIGVAIIGETVYLKPVGFATQHNSLGIPDFLEAMFRMGSKQVAVDLAECKGMDSTFLGVLAAAASSLSRKSGKTVAVLNCDEAAARQFKRIGLTPMLCIRKGKVTPPPVQLRRINFVHFPKTERGRLKEIRRLHQELIKLNPMNEQLFGPFVRMLGEELRKASEQGGQG